MKPEITFNLKPQPISKLPSIEVGWHYTVVYKTFVPSLEAFKTGYVYKVNLSSCVRFNYTTK